MSSACRVALLIIAAHSSSAAHPPTHQHPVSLVSSAQGVAGARAIESKVVHVAALFRSGNRRETARSKGDPACIKMIGIKPWRILLQVLLWWFLNVVFNLANKQCLISWPHPWALATLHQAVGSLCMLPLYIPLPSRQAGSRWRSVRQFPMPSRSELCTVLSVVWLLAIGHVTSTLAPAYGTVAFSNIVKTAEPLFTCTFSFLLFRRTFPLPVYASLMLVVVGVSLVSARDVNFSIFSLVAGMISNAAFALYSIYVKRVLQRTTSLTPQATYALLNMCSCLLLAPIACAVELSGAGVSHTSTVGGVGFVGWRLALLLVGTGAIQYLSNELAFCTLSMIHPVTYAVANTLKRSVVVAASLLFFGQRLPLSGAVGAGMAMCGALVYSLSMANSFMEPG